MLVVLGGQPLVERKWSVDGVGRCGSVNLLGDGSSEGFESDHGKNLE